MPDKVFIETYGCQMNVADSEIVATILERDNFIITKCAEEADVILLNTCSIRDNAEQKIINRVKELQHLRKKRPLRLGIIGCMAEKVGDKLFADNVSVQFIAGPDSYRNIVEIVKKSEYSRVSDIVLSETETYEDIFPDKILTQGISAFVPIMRGCGNFCSYCVVPYTRGVERSRAYDSVLKEIEKYAQNGIKEITLLGQNVNSYQYFDNSHNIGFSDLLQGVSVAFPEMRFRFATSHPKDISDKLIETIAMNSNICRSVHLPVQSGSNAVLKRMNRNYTIEWFLERTEAIRKTIENCSITTDIIAGFCGETEEDHQKTLETMRKVSFAYAYMFKYSERTGTAAAKRYTDDVPDEVKSRRLNEIITLQQELSLRENKKDVGKIFEVLVEGKSKRDENKFMGRTSQNKVVVFPAKADIVETGKYVSVKIHKCSSATLQGELLENL